MKNELKKWQDLGFQLILSKDGSPTLRPYPEGQTMHHVGGALAESIYIYDKAIEIFLEKSTNPTSQLNFFIVGLGLGYIELLILKRLILQNLEAAKIQIVSNEYHPVLINELRDFIFKFCNVSEQEDEVTSTYRKILEQICKTDLHGDDLDPQQSQILQQNMIQLARKFLSSRQWTIEGPLSLDSLDHLQSHYKPSNLIFFDAYSEKASPELWSEAFLEQFIQRICAPSCIFSTYACTGRLKRTLLKFSFQSLRKEGFLGKRHSTLMLR